MMTAKLINKEDIWDWLSENNLWYPEPELKLYGDFDINLLVASGIYGLNQYKTLISLRGGRKLMKSDNGFIMLEIKVREMEDNVFYMKVYTDSKNTIDIKNISPYNGYLFFDVVKE